MKDCVSVKCIYNDVLKKGYCVGVSNNTRSYHEDVIQMCWVKKKPTKDGKCDIEMNAQITPLEAAQLGIALAETAVRVENHWRKLSEAKAEAKT